MERNEIEFSTFMNENKTPQQNVNPNEEIALGTVQNDVELSFSSVGGEPVAKEQPRKVIMESSTNPQLRAARNPQQRRRVIDPSQMGLPAMKEQAQPASANPSIDRAYSLVEKAVERKTEEFKKTMEYLEERDAVNRMAVAEGIEEVEGEVLYMAPKENDKTDIIAHDDIEMELEEAERNAEIAASYDERPIYEQPVVEEEEEFVPTLKDDEQIDSDVEKQTELEAPKKVEVTEHVQEEESEPEKSVDNIFQKKTVVLQQKQEPIDMNSPLNANVSGTDFYIDDVDLEDLDLDGDPKEKENEEEKKLVDKQYDQLKSEILEKVVGTARKIDVSAMKISKKPVTFQNALTKIKKNADVSKVTGTWALMSIQRPYVCSALTGPELTTLYDIDNTNSPFIANIQQLKILYSHDENPYKPKTYEGWAKTIPYSDIDEIFMAEYVATFGRGNYMPYVCEEKNCHNMELKDQKDIMGKMVRFKTDKIKQKFEKIRSMSLTKEMSDSYETVIVPINDMIAIGFRDPSIYTVMNEVSSVNQEFIEKYMQAVNTVMYIDTIYLIGEGGIEDLQPIEYKIYPNDISKTFRSKVASYARILAAMNDEYSIIVAYINSMRSKESGIEYIIPEDKCSKCGAVINEQITSAKQLVFTRPHLVNIATISQE